VQGPALGGGSSALAAAFLNAFALSCEVIGPHGGLHTWRVLSYSIDLCVFDGAQIAAADRSRHD